jgi:acetyl esterase/lipase
MKKVLDELASMKGEPIETLSAEEARKQPTPTDAVMAIMKRENIKDTLSDKVKIENTSIVGTAGRIPLRIFTPKDGKGPFPVIVYFHGGGFVVATNDVYQASAEALADGVGAVVVSPEYGKAPESKFPRAHDDAYDTYIWTLANMTKLHGDPTRVALAGESAGGNLAAATAMQLRDTKQKMPNELLLVYPVASDDLDTLSEKEDANAKPLNRAMMGWFTKNYFRTPADGKDARINLVGANLSGLPPTTIINAELDPLRSDGENLAKKMKAVGDQVEQKTYPGVTHEFFGMGAVVGEAKSAMTFAVDRLKAGFQK